MPHDVIGILKAHRIRPSRRRGQHHVIDPDALRRMVEYAELSGDEEVLEIGAGIGNLTQLLAERAGEVIAIERDPKLVEVLRERVRGYPNVKILQADALEIDLPKFDKAVANLPYYISSDITFKLLGLDFELAVLMYQREFARRLAAGPGSGDYSRLTVNANYRAEVEVLEEIPKAAFWPQPKVSSAIVRIRPREPPFKVLNERLFFDVVRALFQHRRQKVRNALCNSFNEVFPDLRLPKAERRAIIDELLPAGLANAVVMDLRPEEFGEISNYLGGRPATP